MKLYPYFKFTQTPHLTCYDKYSLTADIELTAPAMIKFSCAPRRQGIESEPSNGWMNVSCVSITGDEREDLIITTSQSLLDDYRLYPNIYNSDYGMFVYVDTSATIRFSGKGISGNNLSLSCFYLDHT